MKKIAILALTLALAGCATPYQSFELFGRGGYADKQLSDDTYEVTYYANGMTNMATLGSLLKYRTAEIAIAKGFDNFQVLRGGARVPMSAYGGFKIAQHVVKMYNGQPLPPPADTYIAKDVKAQFAPYIQQQK